MAALRTLWTALVDLYDETLVLIGGNLVALALNLPVAVVLLALYLATLPLLPSEDGSGSQLVLLAIAWLLPLLATPGNMALGALTRVAAGPDAPGLVTFRQGLRARWRVALKSTALSVLVTLALLGNVYFYAVLNSGWLRFLSIPWLYGLLFWLSLHVYLVPLLVHVEEPKLFDLFRRAALLVLAHPWYTFQVLVALLVVGGLSVVFVPAYVLVSGAFISLTQTNALREIRRRHGDLAADFASDEEAHRL